MLRDVTSNTKEWASVLFRLGVVLHKGLVMHPALASRTISYQRIAEKTSQRIGTSHRKKRMRRSSRIAMVAYCPGPKWKSSTKCLDLSKCSGPVFKRRSLKRKAVVLIGTPRL